MYGSSSQQGAYYAQPQPQGQPLQFYAPSPASSDSGFYPGSRPSLEGSAMAQGSMTQGSMTQGSSPGFGGQIQPQGGWWTAFGTGGFEGEPPLLEGKRFCHA
jgi:protein YIPF5/7